MIGLLCMLNNFPLRFLYARQNVAFFFKINLQKEKRFLPLQWKIVKYFSNEQTVKML